MILSKISIDEVRSQFPSLASGFAYLENAGGSQVPKGVADAVHTHLLTDNVQLGAGYSQSVRATEIVAKAHRLAQEFFNAGESGQTFLGASTTALVHMIARAYGEILQSGDEVIIAETNHEANAGAWAELARFGLVVKSWPMDTSSFTCRTESLEKLITGRTRLVTMPHVSNIVGQTEEVEAVCRLAHRYGAHVIVDGVASAPHRPIDVQKLGVDWYVFSIYKVYGPHLAALYGSREALDPLTGPNHAFIPKNSYPYKWEPGGVSTESCAGFAALTSYLAFLAQEDYSGRSTLEKAYVAMRSLEAPLDGLLREWASSRRDVRLIGPAVSNPNSVPTVSFTHATLKSDQISAAVDKLGYGIRHGNMYAVRLLDALQIDRDPGVVRISAVHYNSQEEILGLIRELDRILDGR